MLKTDDKDGRGVAVQVNGRLDELTELSALLLKTMEGERFQLAKKLHDELGGMITAAKMDMQWLSSHLGSSLDAKGAEKFNSVVQMLDQAMMLKRRVVESLRPSLLEHFGLGVAMRSHFDEHCKQAGVECIASLPEDALELDATSQLTFFRVAQDVLAGIIARGGANNVELVIERIQEEGRDGYLMTIGDDSGVPTEAAESLLLISRHRVALAGGRFEFESRPGSGTQVRVFVPRSAAGSA